VYRWTSLLAAFVLLLPAASAAGQDLVYEPTNPAFGGSSVNYSWLLNSANQQNPYQGDRGFSSFRDDPLQNFEQRLQRQVLDQLSRELIQDRFGEVDLTEEGTFDFQQFRVEVRPGPGGISVQVFNKQSGETSTVEIPRF
jgi:curli production assembly/transport component CsgF